MNKNKNPYAPADGTELSLWNIVQFLLKKSYWLLLAGIVAAAGVYAVLTLVVTPTYESKISFYVYNSANNTQQAGTINNSDLQAAESLCNDLFQNSGKQLRSGRCSGGSECSRKAVQKRTQPDDRGVRRLQYTAA